MGGQIPIHYPLWAFEHEFQPLLSDNGGGVSDEGSPWDLKPIHALYIGVGFLGVGLFVWGVFACRKWVNRSTKFDGRRHHDPEFLGQVASAMVL